jgi:Ti-type conjugative transfer relaxase TraA
MKPISRASGRSAVASAAYRAGERLTNERDGLTHDFTRRGGVEHEEIAIPAGVDVRWALDRSTLWNAAEQVENRKDARVAREFEIALPHELTGEQRLEATRQFAQGLADRYGAAVDFAIHAPHGETDVRNHHAHLMMTVRAVGPEGFADKTRIERENKWLLSHDLPTSQMQLRDIRQSWEQIANEKLAEAGLDVRIDHRSHQERGLEIEPTEHMGVHATQMQRRGLDVSRVRLDAAAARRNAELIREKPEQVLSIVTGEKSVFDRRDVAKALHRYIDEPEAFQAAFAKVMASPALVELVPEKSDGPGGGDPRIKSGEARYSTREMVDIERGLADGAMRMTEGRRHGVDRSQVEAALAVQDAAIRWGAAADSLGRIARGELSEAEGQAQVSAAGLSDEQRGAIEHIAGSEQIAAVVGFAGAGKSTMLAAAREAWQAQGYTVHGAALSGKAAEGLEESSGIQSRTLASWDYGWQAGRGELGPKDVLVIDEAGMVGSRQLARFVGEAERTGAKLVLVGDHEQLQAIGAGAPFRAIAERVGFASLQDIRRQREDWQRGASADFARHRTGEGLASYAERGAVTFSDTRDAARGAIVQDYIRDLEQRPEGSRVAMAHRRVDVRALNEDIRAARQERGELARGAQGLGADAGERVFETNDGKRSFAAGDRIVFLENNRDLGVKNGMLGTVAGVEDGRIIARLDGKGRDGAERMVTVSTADYAAIDHGYATTIHKTQGATVDRSFVLASGTMDRHLTYVAMTRHRDGAQLYAAREEFKGRGADQSPMEALTARLGRDGSKETTLDYAKEFSARRGIAEQLGVGSEIDTTRQAEPRREKPERETAAPAAQQEPAKKRGMFAGLKLDAGRPPAKSREARETFAGVKLSASERPASAKDGERDRLLQASEGYAKAFSDAARMGGLGLPIVEHQKQALEKAGAALDAIRPESRRELQSALRHDPQTLRAMNELQGAERAARLVAGMERERQAQLDPNVRAERLAAQWNGLEQERSKLRGWDQREAREKVEAQMRSVAGEIGKDKPVESALRARQKDFGIEERSSLGRALREKDVRQALEQRVTHGQRERGHEQSM